MPRVLDRTLPWIVIALLAVAYLFTMTCNYNFDALMYSNIVEGSYSRAYVDTNRLLYTAFVNVVYTLFLVIGLPLRALYIFQGVSLVSSLGILALLAWWFRHRLSGLATAALLLVVGTGSSWWRFTSDPHSHMVSMFMLVISVFFWMAWLKKQELRFLVGAGVFWFAAIVFHQVHVLMAATFFFSSPDKKRAAGLVAVVGVAAFLSYAIGTVIHQSTGSMKEILAFYLGKGGSVGFSFQPVTFLKTLYAWLFRSPWSYVLALAALTQCRRPPLSLPSSLVFTWLACYLPFFLFFEAVNYYFHIFLVPLFVLTAGECMVKRPPYIFAACLLAALALHVPKEWAVRRAESDPARNPLVQQAQVLQAATADNDIIVLSTRPDMRLNFYVNYFSLRVTVPVDFLFDVQQEKALPIIDRLLRQTAAAGGKVFFLKAAVSAGGVAEAYQQRWMDYVNSYWALEPTATPAVAVGELRSKPLKAAGRSAPLS